MVIALNLRLKNYASFKINGINYYVFSLTLKGFKPGKLSSTIFIFYKSERLALLVCNGGYLFVILAEMIKSKM